MKKEITALVCAIVLTACGTSDRSAFSGTDGEVKLIALNPADAQVALVQARMHPQVNRTVHVFAPEGQALKAYLAQIDAFNTRSDSATSWNEVVSTEGDFVAQALDGNFGNVALLSGSTAVPGGYAARCIGAGINILSTSPLATASPEFHELERSFGIADEKNLVLYELMPERYETAAAIQRALARTPEFYGIQLCGTADAPTVVSESLLPLRATGADLLTADSLTLASSFFSAAAPRIDLIQLAVLGPERIKYNRQIQFTDARRYPAAVTATDYRRLTGANEFPSHLRSFVSGDTLQLPVDGEVRYVLNGVHTRFSIRHDTNADITAKSGANRPDRTNAATSPSKDGAQADIRQRLVLQGSDAVLTLTEIANSLPQLTAHPAAGAAPEKFALSLRAALKQLDGTFPGLGLEPSGNGFRIVIPAKHRPGETARAAQATGQYLAYLVQGYPPFWEVDQMLAKYYTLTRAFDEGQ